MLESYFEHKKKKWKKKVRQNSMLKRCVNKQYAKDI